MLDKSVDYIRSIRLEPVALAHSETLPPLPDIATKSDAFVNAGSVVAFTADVPGEHRIAVLDSVLFAQLAANAVAQRISDPLGWYQEYQRVLTNLGWAVNSFSMIRRKLNRLKVEVAEAALDIMSAALGLSSLKVLDTAMNSLRDLKGEGGLIQLFEGSSLSDTIASFQLGQASADEDGNVVMPIGMFYFRSSEVKNRFLFFRWNSKQIQLFGDTQSIELSMAQYKLVAGHVREQLQDYSRVYVKGVKLSPAPN